MKMLIVLSIALLATASCYQRANAECLFFCGKTSTTTAGKANASVWNGKYGKEAYAIHYSVSGVDQASLDNANKAQIAATHLAKAGADNGLGGKGVTGHDGAAGGRESNNR